MTFLIRFALGAVVTFVALSIMMDPLSAIGIIVLSVVCTGGIGLVVWIPLFWFVGYVTLALFQASWKKWDSLEIGANPHGPLSREMLGLVTYMRKAEAGGLGHDQITQRLLGLGWSAETIHEARRILNS